VRQSLPIPIAVVLGSFDPGGTEHQMTELVRRLDPRLFTVHAVSLSGRGVLRARIESVAASIPVFPVNSLKSVATLREMRRMARWCREHGIQVLHACDFYANVFALPAAALAGVPVRIGARRDVFIPERTRGHQLLQRLS
jgi:hypothetical protein